MAPTAASARPSPASLRATVRARSPAAAHGTARMRRQADGPGVRGARPPPGLPGDLGRAVRLLPERSVRAARREQQRQPDGRELRLVRRSADGAWCARTRRCRSKAALRPTTFRCRCAAWTWWRSPSSCARSPRRSSRGSRSSISRRRRAGKHDPPAPLNYYPDDGGPTKIVNNSVQLVPDRADSGVRLAGRRLRQGARQPHRGVLHTALRPAGRSPTCTRPMRTNPEALDSIQRAGLRERSDGRNPAQAAAGSGFNADGRQHVPRLHAADEQRARSERHSRPTRPRSAKTSPSSSTTNSSSRPPTWTTSAACR